MNKTAPVTLSPSARVASRVIKYWLPVIAMAALIFFFSTEHFGADRTDHAIGNWLMRLFPHISQSGLVAVHFLIRKLAHGTEYFVFSLLLARALRNDCGGVWRARHALWTVTVVFLYALSDEWHQTFVPNRTGSFHDVLIDLLGGICGVLWMFWLHRGISGRQSAPWRRKIT